MGAVADFSGWATVANIKCSDGRTITEDAFKHQDSTKVPLVYAHMHNDHTQVLGYAVLQHRAEGMYCEGFFNGTERGKIAKELVSHGDIEALSIYANHLVEKEKVVLHGNIREVSLVLAGANPSAKIQHVNLEHSDGEIQELDDEAIILTGRTIQHADADVSEEASKSEPVKKDTETKVDPEDEADDESDDEDEGDDVEHADTDSGDDETLGDIFNTLTEKQKNVVYYMLTEAQKGAAGTTDVAHSDRDDVAETMESLSDKQRDVVIYMLGEVLEHADADDDENDDDDTAEDDEADEQDGEAEADTETDSADVAQHSDDQEGSAMGNVFDKGATNTDGGSKIAEQKELLHSNIGTILKSAERGSTFRTELNEFALKHGIEDIGVLFPDAKSVTATPEWLSRRTEWVSTVMTETRHTPFSRIKSLAADLTLAAARAKGYIKGNFKEEEFFKVYKRVTIPQTIYKKQKLDRDDILDITDFDVVLWLKGEMRLMLEEEIARAVLLGDGRSAGDDDKINEENIRPIATDSDFYVTYINVNLGDANSSADEVIDALTLQRRNYRGSGNPTLFTSETFLARMLLLKDTLSRRLYVTLDELKAALRVDKIVTVEVMDEPTSDVVCILVNLADYTIGADRGGDIAMFDDFDIDYNQQKYLIETRISGALTKPKSALVVKKVAAGATLRTPVAPSWNASTHAVTVPTTTGVTYRNKSNNVALSNGTPVVLTEDQTLTVIATPASGSDYLEGSANDEFVFTYEDGQVAVR